MPYITKERRKVLDPYIGRLYTRLDVKGDYNYVMTKLLHLFLKSRGPLRYDTLSEAHGLAQDVAAEFYHSIVRPYEIKKEQENGPIGILTND